MDQISNWHNFWSKKDIIMIFCANESWDIILLKKQHRGTPKLRYHPLLFQINHPDIHHLRCMRIQSSPLNAHKYFSHPNKSRLCDTCRVPETADHFLLRCKKFHRQRKSFLKEVSPVVTELGYSISSPLLLGFVPGLRSKKSEKSTRSLRRCILLSTLGYIKDTGGFAEDPT